ncbi:MAG: efflux RND transporter permease subunit [Nitrospira sp.]
MLLDEAVLTGIVFRIRPIVMSALVAALGRTPLSGRAPPGLEIQRPLAIVVIGGLMSFAALLLVILPVLFR